MTRGFTHYARQKSEELESAPNEEDVVISAAASRAADEDVCLTTFSSSPRHLHDGQPWTERHTLINIVGGVPQGDKKEPVHRKTISTKLSHFFHIARTFTSRMVHAVGVWCCKLREHDVMNQIHQNQHNVGLTCFLLVQAVVCERRFSVSTRNQGEIHRDLVKFSNMCRRSRPEDCGHLSSTG